MKKSKIQPKADPRLISYIGNADAIGIKKPKADPRLISYVEKGLIPKWAFWFICLPGIILITVLFFIKVW